jgi:methyl-accepting chemotaxis protein
MTSDQMKSPPESLPAPCDSGEQAGSCTYAVNAVNSIVPAEALDRLSNAFQRSARRWEMIIYPAVFTLILMVGAAFFFIYTLTRDMRELAAQAQPEIGSQLNRVAESVTRLSASLDQMNHNIDLMRIKMDGMSIDMTAISKEMKNLQQINQQMAQMNATINVMTANTEAIRWNMQSMNQSISRPMSMMNSFMPW